MTEKTITKNGNKQQICLNDKTNFDKDEIIEILETEIARRYYFDTAEIETTFDDDPDIREALKLFSDKTKYYSLLQPK